MKYLFLILASVIIAFFGYRYYDTEFNTLDGVTEGFAELKGSIASEEAQLIIDKENKSSNKTSSNVFLDKAIDNKLEYLEKDLVNSGKPIDTEELKRLGENAKEGLRNLNIKNDDIEGQMKAVVDIINKTSPMQIDSITKLVGASYANNVLSYNYELDFTKITGTKKSKIISKEQLDIFAANLKKSNSPIACRHSINFLTQGIKYLYKYRDASGMNTLQYTLSSEDCS